MRGACSVVRSMSLLSDGLLIPGVIGNKSRHLQTEEEARAQVSHKNLWIDIGAGSRQEILKQGIGIGAGVVFSTPFHAYDNGAVMGKALDNRISCTVLIEALKTLAPKLKKTTLLGMFTIQEEIGAKGAQVVAFDERPAMTITLDNVPTQNPNEVRPGDVDLNQGPVIRISTFILRWHSGCSPIPSSRIDWWKWQPGKIFDTRRMS